MPDEPINNKTQRQMLMDLTVSAAVHENQLNRIIMTLKEHCENEAIWRGAFDERLKTVETMQGRQDERIKHAARSVTGINAVISAAMAAIAGYIGLKS